MTGRQTYARWCAYATSETTDYWDDLSPAGQLAWDHLAEWQREREAAAHDAAVIAVAEASEDAWTRREQRRCST
jgi:hypothetical protein